MAYSWCDVSRDKLSSELALVLQAASRCNCIFFTFNMLCQLGLTKVIF